MFRRLIAGLGRKSAAPDIPALQGEAVRCVAADIDDLHDGEWGKREWVHIAVNHEMSIGDGLRSSTQAIVLAHEPGGELEALGFRLSMASKQRLIALRDAMTAAGQEPWTILDLAIERDGRYDFAFGYASPPRLGGDLLHAPLRGLLARYAARRV